jgi:F-type H+-transporting ATPase subunit a
MLFAAATALDHVMDTYVWHISDHPHIAIPLPVFFTVGGKPFGISKYTFLMLLAAGLILWIYLPLAKKIQNGQTPTGIFWNLFEFMLTFVRDNIAKPYIGKDADQYVPYLWTVFLFVMFCNLFGMVPFLGSPTASFTVSFVLAGTVFVFIHGHSMAKFGVVNHLRSFAPDLDMPFAMKLAMSFMLWPIEFVGLIIKCFVLAVRLFANMFAGHIVLGTILLFIPMVANAALAVSAPVTLVSAAGVLALSFLELFVAFLHAFLFTFLTALFFGGIMEHAEHAAHGGHHVTHEHEHGKPGDAGDEDAHLKKTSPEHGH